MSQQVTGNLNSLNANVLVQTDVATLPSVGSVGVQIGGNFTATLSFQATIDQINWFAVNATPITASGGVPVSSTTAGGQFAIAVNGFAQVRVIATAYSAGTAIVSLDTGTAAVQSLLLAIATQGDNQGGPPLASGLPSLVFAAADDDKNFQGSNNYQGIVTAVPGQTFITFLDNPWIQGLTIGAGILLSASPNGQALEEVIVSTNNIPSVGTGSFVVNLSNPVVNPGLNYGTFDVFGVDGPNVAGITQRAPGLTVPGETVIGLKGALQLLYNVQGSDPKRPVVPWTQAPFAPGVGAVLNVNDPTGSGDLPNTRRFLEAILYEIRALNFMVAQLKDGGPMELPSEYQQTMQTSE